MRKLFAILVAGSMLTLGGVAQAAPVAKSSVLGVAIQGLAPLTIGGTGTVSVTGSTVKVPAGIETGARLRLVSEGEAGVAGGAAGDLYIVILLRDHPLFERDGRHLHCEVPVPFVVAALGGEIEVPSLEGKVSMSLPESTQSGRVMRLRGKGLPPLQPRADAAQLERQRGDIYVKIFVEVPARLTRRQRELLEEFAEASGTEASPVTKGFMDKLREFFE